MKLIISHTHATYVMEDIVVLRGNCLSVTFLEKKKKKVSASAPGSHCYATQQLDIQVNRSSTSVGGRKNAKPWCLSSGDTFTTSEKQTRGLWEVNIVERVQCIKLGGGIVAAGSVRFEWYVGGEVQFGGRVRAESATFGSVALQKPQQLWGAVRRCGRCLCCAYPVYKWVTGVFSSSIGVKRVLRWPRGSGNKALLMTLCQVTMCCCEY